MTELTVLGSTSKLTTGSLNQKTEGKLSQEDASIFAALFQGLTLANTSQEQLPDLGQDSVEVEEMLADLYSLIQPSQLSLEDVVAKFQGLSTDKQQDLSQALAGLFTNQESTVQAGQLQGFNINEFKVPKANYEELAILVQEMGKQGSSNKLNTEMNVQNNTIYNQLGNPDLVNLNNFDFSSLKNLDFNNLTSLDLGNLNSLNLGKLNSLDLNKLSSSDLSILKTLDLGNLSNTDLNQDITKFNNGELGVILKALFKSDQTIAVTNGAENTSTKLDSVQVQEQKGYTSFISNLIINSNSQAVTANTQVVEESNSSQKVDAEVLDLTKGELQPMRMNVEGEANRLDATNKQANIENLPTNRNFTEELGKIMIKSFKLPDGASETKIQLHPQELGQIDVKLVANNGQISAQLITETALGKELLEGQINQLKQSLIQQGYQVDRIEVQQAPPSSNFNNDFRGSSSFNFAGQNSSRQFNRENPNNKYSNFNEDVDDFVQEMLNVTGIDYTV